MRGDRSGGGDGFAATTAAEECGATAWASGAPTGAHSGGGGGGAALTKRKRGDLRLVAHGDFCAADVFLAEVPRVEPV